MSQITQIYYTPDLNPAKKDLLKIYLSFDKDDINKQFVIEINHIQGEGKNLTNITRHGLFLITAEVSDQVYEHILKNKISKIGQGQENVQFIARIFSLSGRVTSEKYRLG
jgi:hypothetical protein